MIEVTSYSNDRPVDTVTAETPEGALTAARTLWDEARSGIQGQRRAIAFLVDGVVVRRVEKRP